MKIIIHAVHWNNTNSTEHSNVHLLITKDNYKHTKT